MSERSKEAARNIYRLKPYHALTPCTTVRQIASIVGQIVSMSLGLGPIARLMTRSLYTIINHRITWHDKVLWTKEAGEEIKFWEDNIESLNERNEV